MGENNAFVCINCMRPSSSLFTLYSADVIRITECVECGSPVDKYIEYDIVLVLIDLILQYQQAYRHILFNSKSKPFTRLVFIFVLCDAYRTWIEQAEYGHSLFNLEWRFYLSLLRSSVEFGAFSFALFSFRIFFDHFGTLSDGPRGVRTFFESTLVGFFGSLFVVVSIIWQLHAHLSYRLLTHFFIFLSHLQIQRTLFPSIGLPMNLFAVFVGLFSQFATRIIF